MKVNYKGHELEAVYFEGKFDLWIDGCEFMTSEYFDGSTVELTLAAGRQAVDDAIRDGILE